MAVSYLVIYKSLNRKSRVILSFSSLYLGLIIATNQLKVLKVSLKCLIGNLLVISSFMSILYISGITNFDEGLQELDLESILINFTFGTPCFKI